MTQIDITLRGIPASRIAAVLAAIAGTETLDPSLVEAEPPAPQVVVGQVVPNPVPENTYQPFDPNVAASVFGAKQGQPAPAGNGGAFVPPATVATAPGLTSLAPASSAGGGTPGGAVSWPATVDISLGFDKFNLPWDSRIHGSGKNKRAKTQDWTPKRNIAPELVAQVEAELRAIAAQIAPQQPAQGVHRINDVVQPQGGARTDVQVMAQGIAQAGYNPGGVPATVDYGTHQVTSYAPPAPVGPTYGDVMNKVTSSIANKLIPGQTVAGMFAHYGVKDVADLQNHPQLWATIISEIDRLSSVPQ